MKLDAKIGYSETQEALELDHGGENFRTFFIEGGFFFFWAKFLLNEREGKKMGEKQ